MFKTIKNLDPSFTRDIFTSKKNTSENPGITSLKLYNSATYGGNI